MSRLMFIILWAMTSVGTLHAGQAVQSSQASAIFDAAAKGDLARVRQIVDANPAIVDAKNERGSPLLLVAVGKGQQDVAALLIERGTMVDGRNGEGLTPLLLAARTGPPAMAELLLARGASHAVTDRDSSTPLLLAAMSGQTDIVKLLLARGADVNAANGFGSTPMSVAQREGHSEIATLLAGSGAQKTAPRSPPDGPYLGQIPPGLEPVRFAPGFVSTERDELNSVFTPDGLEFYFTVNRGPRQWTIMVTRRGASRWTPPEVASFSGKFSDVDLFITPDGKRLFFCSNRPRSGQTDPRRDFDIWVAEREGARWSEPKNLGAPVNSDQNEFYPSLTRAGLLLFESHRPDETDADLYFAQPQGASFPRAEKAGPPLSTEAFDGDGLISPDGSLVVLTKNPSVGTGAGDLYVSFRRPDGRWTEPKDLGPEVNTRLNENCPILSPDGKYLFFSRGGDIYWVDARILDQHRPR